jgi:hypothetical protein
MPALVVLGVIGCAEAPGRGTRSDDAGYPLSYGDGDTENYPTPSGGDGDTTGYPTGPGTGFGDAGAGMGGVLGQSTIGGGAPTASDLLCTLFGGCGDAGTTGSASDGGASTPNGADGGLDCKNLYCFDVFDCYIFHPQAGACGITACNLGVCQ